MVGGMAVLQTYKKLVSPYALSGSLADGVHGLHLPSITSLEMYYLPPVTTSIVAIIDGMFSSPTSILIPTFEVGNSAGLFAMSTSMVRASYLRALVS